MLYISYGYGGSVICFGVILIWFCFGLLACCHMDLCRNVFVFKAVLNKQYTFEHTVGETINISMQQYWTCSHIPEQWEHTISFICTVPDLESFGWRYYRHWSGVVFWCSHFGVWLVQWFCVCCLWGHSWRSYVTASLQWENCCGVMMTWALLAWLWWWCDLLW